MKGPARSLASLMRELAANARLRWGIWLVFCLLLGHAILAQSDRLAAARHDHAAATERLRKAEAILRQRDTFALLDTEREHQSRIRSLFWQAETEGLAQAKLQTAVADTLRGLGLTDIHFRSGSSQPVSGLPGVWKTQIRLDARFRPGYEFRIVHALSTNPDKLVVDRLDLGRHRTDDSYLVLIVSAYFMGLKSEPPN